MTRTRRAAVVVMGVMVLAACRGHESVTGAYGQNVVAGYVTMTTTASPAGVRLTIANSGMTTILGDDGRFVFTGVPDGAEIVFVRESDGVHARLAVPSNATNLHIELAPNEARSGRQRAVAPKPPYLQFEGIVQSVSASSIVVRDSHGHDVAIAIDAKSVIRRGDQSLTAADVKSGDRVHVKASVSGDVKTAVEITVQGGEDVGEGEHGDHGGQMMTANGLVTATGASQITVSTAAHGEVVVKIDGSTIIKKQGQTIAPADIHAGDDVNTRGTRIDDHTERAEQIEVRGSGHNH